MCSICLYRHAHKEVKYCSNQFELLDITDYDRITELITKYDEFKDKIYVSLTGNSDYVSLQDCYKTMLFIKDECERIKQLGLSPMETAMYVYDYVKNRVYTLESKEESCSKSRDLTEVIFGDKIVCVGYANIFRAMLKYVGIESYKSVLSEINNPERGHARSVAYIKDSKYNIDGVYYFDPTWDSKKKDDRNLYLYLYRFFAKTRKYMDDNDFGKLTNALTPMYSQNITTDLKKLASEGKYEELIPYITTINNMNRVVEGKSLINGESRYKLLKGDVNYNVDEVLDKFEDVFEKFNREIPAETMLKIFNNVRKVEYYQNHELYPYTKKDMYITYLISDWHFSSSYCDPLYNLLSAILEDKSYIDSVSNFSKYGEKSGLFKEIGRVRVAKAISLACEKKRKE